MITGDLNLVEIQFTAQYHITDLNRYLFAADDPGYRFQYADGDKVQEHRSHQEGYPDGQSIRDALEIAVRRAVGHRTIDQALVSEREVIELETMNTAQQILDAYDTGLAITSIQLQEVKAPDAVQDAFDDVLRAREARDTRINEALSFESRVLPEARGDAERLRRAAEACRAKKHRRGGGIRPLPANPGRISRRAGHYQNADLPGNHGTNPAPHQANHHRGRPAAGADNQHRPEQSDSPGHHTAGVAKI